MAMCGRGSLDILTDSASFLPGLMPDTHQKRATASGYKEESPDLKGLCDLVIMNPPFTRNDIRNRSLPPDIRERVQKHEIELAKQTPDKDHRNAIDQSAIGTFFSPIADRLPQLPWNCRDCETVSLRAPVQAASTSGTFSLILTDSTWNWSLPVTTTAASTSPRTLTFTSP